MPFFRFSLELPKGIFVCSFPRTEKKKERGKIYAERRRDPKERLHRTRMMLGRVGVL